jgi:hypothetical protein
MASELTSILDATDVAANKYFIRRVKIDLDVFWMGKDR